MTQNEASAEALKVWLGDQDAMKAKTAAHLKTLLMLKSSSSQAWLDDAIKRADESIKELERSMQLTRDWIALAEAERLHNPARG